MSEDALLFFGGRPGALPIYEALEERLRRELANVEVDVGRTQITFKNRRVFGCASFLPVKGRPERPDPYLTVTFGLGYPKSSGRIAAVVEAAPNRWTHHVLVGSPEEIDGELMGWMREAYEFSEGKR